MGFKLFFLLFILVVSVAAKTNYTNYKVYNIVAQTEDDVEYLKEIQNVGGVDFWDDHVKLEKDVKVMVAPKSQKKVEDALKEGGIDYNVAIEDVQRLINTQLTSLSTQSSRDTSINFNVYNDLNTIYSWLDNLAVEYPGIVKTVVMGQSVQGREIKGVVIDFHPEREDKLIAVIEGTMHAREWISAASIVWTINTFLTSDDPAIRALAENFEWHIFPVTNPDGYVYTFTTNRLWRKNRSTASATTCGNDVDNDMSNGVDLNRNFDFYWMTTGASSDPCSNTFGGPSAFSEPETRAVANYALGLQQQGRLMYYFAIHSYSQLILVPYSHVSGADLLQVGNYGDMFEVGSKAADLVKMHHGTVYSVGPSANLLYEMSGTSFDWAKSFTSVPFSYLIELRDLGEYGFLLPADQIVPTGQELVEAFVEMDRAARSLNYYQHQFSGAAGVMASLVVLVAGFIVALVH